MSKRQRAFGFVFATVLGLGLGMTAYWMNNRLGEEPDPRRTDFTLATLDGGQASLSDWDGKIIVLNFWATWCPPCLKEMPMFMALQADYGEQGVQFVGVAMDREADAKKLVEKLGLNYPSMVGVHRVSEIMRTYGNQPGTLPYTVVIDRDGVVRHTFDREVQREQLEPLLKSLL